MPKGDQVQAGQVLARLDAVDAELQTQQAEAGLETARAQLTKVEAGPTDAALAAAEAALASAKAQYEEVAAGPLSGDYASAQAALKSAQTSYQQLLVGPTDDEVIVLKANMERAGVALKRAQGDYDRFSWREGFEASPQAAALQLATIDYQQALAQYNVAVAGPTEGQIEGAKAQIAEAKARLERLASGADANLKGAAAQVARARADLELLQGRPTAEDLVVARAQVAQAETALERAGRQVALSQLIAPESGTVARVAINVGLAVSPASPAIVLGHYEHPPIKALVNEAFIADIEPGQSVHVTLEAQPGRSYAGRVTEISEASDSIYGTTNYEISVDIVRCEDLRPGMLATLEIVTDERVDALLIPRAALRWREEQWFATLWQGDRRSEVQVTVGIRSDGKAEILSGLTEGDEVIIDAAPVSTGKGETALAALSGLGQGGAR